MRTVYGVWYKTLSQPEWQWFRNYQDRQHAERVATRLYTSLRTMDIIATDVVSERIA